MVDDLLDIGVIRKAHGIRGEVVVELHSERVERTTPGATFRTTRGDLVATSARPHQGRWIFAFEGIVDQTVASRRQHDMGVQTLFGGGDEGPSFDDRPKIGDETFEKSQRLAFEKEMLGLYVSDHPLMGLEGALKRKAEDTIADLAEAEDGSMVTVGGVVTGLQRKWTRKGDLMAVLVLEDLTDSVETMVFPRTFADYGHLLEDDRIVVIRGRADGRDDQPKLMAQSIEVLDTDSLGSAPPLRRSSTSWPIPSTSVPCPGSSCTCTRGTARSSTFPISTSSSPPAASPPTAPGASPSAPTPSSPPR